MTKKVASYANLGNLLCRTARGGGNYFKTRVVGKTTTPESLLHPSEEPRAQDGRCCLFVLFSGGTLPTRPAGDGCARRAASSGHSPWPRPNSSAPQPLAPLAHAASLSPPLHYLVISEAPRAAPPPPQTPLLKGAQTRVKRHPSPTDRDW